MTVLNKNSVNPYHLTPELRKMITESQKSIKVEDSFTSYKKECAASSNTVRILNEVKADKVQIYTKEEIDKIVNDISSDAGANILKISGDLTKKVDIDDFGVKFSKADKKKLDYMSEPKFKGFFMSLDDLEDNFSGESGACAYVDDDITSDNWSFYIYSSKNKSWVKSDKTPPQGLFKISQSKGCDCNKQLLKLKNKVKTSQYGLSYSQPKIEDYSKTIVDRYFNRKSSTVFVDVTNSEEGNGTIFSPYNNFQSAIKHIKDIGVCGHIIVVSECEVDGLVIDCSCVIASLTPSLKSRIVLKNLELRNGAEINEFHNLTLEGIKQTKDTEQIIIIINKCEVVREHFFNKGTITYKGCSGENSLINLSCVMSDKCSQLIMSDCQFISVRTRNTSGLFYDCIFISYETNYQKCGLQMLESESLTVLSRCEFVISSGVPLVYTTQFVSDENKIKITDCQLPDLRYLKLDSNYKEENFIWN